MLANVNEALIRRYYADFANDYSDARVAAVMGEVLTDDFVFHPPNNVEGYAGAERHRQWLAWHHRALANQHYEIEDVVATDERGAARWTLTGTHSEEVLGIPPARQTVTVTGQDFFRLRGGRIAELWRAFDWRAIDQQVSQTAAKSVDE
jgi:steroid delta-isomerase-like uncharacterized protein